MAERTLVVKPIGGLANRLRVLATGMQLAGKLRRRLLVDWQPCSGFNCPLNRILTPGLVIPGTAPRGTPVLRTDAGPLRVATIQDPGDDSCMAVTSCHPLVLTDEAGPWFSKDQCRYYTERAALWLRKLTPSTEVQRITGSVDARAYTGVHVRRRDSTLSIKASPTDAFFHVLDEENITDMIFLATDSAREEESFQARYGPDDVLIYPKRSRSRKSIVGVQDAFVDLLLLSRTAHIYGSVGSSFGQVAHSIGRVPLTEVTR